MIAGFLSVAALLLEPAAGHARAPWLPFPFDRWAPATAAERELDRLITEVVARLEQGDVRFSQWQSRDIKAEFGALRLTVPRTRQGLYSGHNFLFEREKYGMHFRARFGVNGLKFFVPSACLARMRAAGRSRVYRLETEDMPPFQTAHVPHDERQFRRDLRAMTLPFEIQCDDIVRIRFYNSAFDRSHERRYPLRHFWMGVTIFRAPPIR